MTDELLPIVQRAYDFAVALYAYVNRFPRIHRPLPPPSLPSTLPGCARSVRSAAESRVLSRRRSHSLQACRGISPRRTRLTRCHSRFIV